MGACGCKTNRIRQEKDLYVVMGRSRYQLLSDIAHTNKELNHCLNMLDNQSVWYISEDLEDAERYANRAIALVCDEPKRAGWVCDSIYLIRSALRADLQEGLVNQPIVWGWSRKLNEKVPRGIKQYSGHFYVV